MNNDKLILLVGKSGSGKTSISEYMNKQYGFVVVDSYTTRPRRSSDEVGHIFISHNQYSQLKNKVATTYYNGNYYCATKEQCDTSDIYVIDPYGVNELKANYKGEKELVIVYLNVGVIERFARMLKRGDSLKATFQRINHDRKVFKDFVKQEDVIVVDNESSDVHKTASEILGKVVIL